MRKGNKMLQDVNVSQIYPHPNNPRKDLGDLEELVERIKTKGILQNLTIVPRGEQNEYTVVIGHRRLEAAKRAGMDTVPCSITEMSETYQEKGYLVVWEQQRQQLKAMGFRR